MYKLLPVLALSLLTAACVSHDPDPDDLFAENDPYWETKEVVQPAPVYTPAPRQVQVQPVVVKTAPAPQTEPTWWQQNKQKHVVKIKVPTCPCKDPNDPCPQCYQK